MGGTPHLKERTVLKIRLRRMGARKDPFYRLVVSDGRNRPSGRFVETIGYYDPGTDPVTIQVDVEKANEWMRRGAQPSDTVRSLLEKAGSAQA